MDTVTPTTMTPAPADHDPEDRDAWIPNEAARFLLRQLRAYFQSAPGQTSQPGEIDWIAVARLAMIHRVDPLLLQQLETLPSIAPPALIAVLRQHVRSSALRNLMLTRELMELARMFAEHEIEMVPLKGPVLAQRLYGSLGLRPCNDLDILIKPQHARKVGELLLARGYGSQVDWSVWRRRVFALARGYHHGYEHPEKQIPLEVHWKLGHKRLAGSQEKQGFWERVEPFELQGVKISVNPPEDLLVMLTVHGTKHHWNQLRLICDIAALLRRYPDLDWAVVDRNARRIGARRMLHVALWLAHDTLGTSLCDSVYTAIGSDPEVRSLTQDIQALLFSDQDPEADVALLERFYLRMQDQPQHRARYRLGSLFSRVCSYAMRSHALAGK